ncbi:MAG: phospholipid-binding protein MlaC [Myxococcales bacterium]
MRKPLALLFALSFVPAAIAATPPVSAVQASNDRVRAALDRYFKAEGAAKTKAREDARAAVGSLLDFEALAQATMGKHWSELKGPQRTHYTEALRGAMEANYLSKMERGQVDMSKVKNEIVGESKDGGRSIVKTKVVAGDDTAQVDYVMEQRKRGWKAVDVVTEGVSLVDTYKDQVNKVMPKKGIDGVISALERAKKRIEEEQAQPSTAAAK